MNEAPVYPKGVTSHLIRYFIRSKQLDIKTIASQYFDHNFWVTEYLNFSIRTSLVIMNVRRRAMPIIPSKINMTILIFYLQ